MKRFERIKDGVQPVSEVHLWLILMKCFHAIESCGSQGIRSSGLGDSDFRVLEVLLHKGPLPVNVIGPKVFLTAGSISTAVDRLHERGLVSRIDSQKDRRVRLVDLTVRGRRLIERVFRAHKRELARVMVVVTPAERSQLAAALRKLGKHAAECRTQKEDLQARRAV